MYFVSIRQKHSDDVLLCLSSSSTFSDITSVAADWPQWQYLHDGNQPMLQIRLESLFVDCLDERE